MRTEKKQRTLARIMVAMTLTFVGVTGKAEPRPGRTAAKEMRSRVVEAVRERADFSGRLAELARTDPHAEAFLRGERTEESMAASERLYERLYTERPGGVDFAPKLESVLGEMETKYSREEAFRNGYPIEALTKAVQAERETLRSQVATPAERAALLDVAAHFSEQPTYTAHDHQSATANVRALAAEMVRLRNIGDESSRAIADVIGKVIPLAGVNPAALRDIPRILSGLANAGDRTQATNRLNGVLAVLQYRHAADKTGREFEASITKLAETLAGPNNPALVTQIKMEIMQRERIITDPNTPNADKGIAGSAIDQGFSLARIDGRLKAKLMQKKTGGKVEFLDDLLANVKDEMAKSASLPDQYAKLKELHDYLLGMRLERLFQTVRRYMSMDPAQRIATLRCAMSASGVFSKAAAAGACASLALTLTVAQKEQVKEEFAKFSVPSSIISPVGAAPVAHPAPRGTHDGGPSKNPGPPAPLPRGDAT